MKITFKLEHPKRNRSAVSARVYHEKQRYKFATGISVPTALWSGNAGGLKTGVQVTARHGMECSIRSLRGIASEDEVANGFDLADYLLRWSVDKVQS